MNFHTSSANERIAAALDVDSLVLFQDPARLTGDDEPALQQRKNKILEIVDREIDIILHERW